MTRKRKDESEGRKIRADRVKQPVGGELLSRNPPPPSRYQDKVKNIWTLACRDLEHRGRLLTVVVHVLEQYCDAYELYLDSVKQIADEGAVILEDGKMKKHPATQVRKEAITDMSTLEKKLGFTPYSRDRIEPASPNKTQEKDPIAEFLQNN